MAEFKLKPKSPNYNLPFKSGNALLRLKDEMPLTIIFQNDKTSKEFQIQPSAVKKTKYGDLIWFARNQAVLFGKFDNDKIKQADMSDALTFFVLEGENAPDVLARLFPIDLRPKNAPAKSFRTRIEDIPSLIISRPESYEIGVPSSMAQSAIDHIQKAMKNVESLKH